MTEPRPLDTLNEARNKNVIVELKNNKQLVGKLKAFDIHVNTVLENCEEKVDGDTDPCLFVLGEIHHGGVLRQKPSGGRVDDSRPEEVLAAWRQHVFHEEP